MDVLERAWRLQRQDGRRVVYVDFTGKTFVPNEAGDLHIHNWGLRANRDAGRFARWLRRYGFKAEKRLFVVRTPGVSRCVVDLALFRLGISSDDVKVREFSDEYDGSASG